MPAEDLRSLECLAAEFDPAEIPWPDLRKHNLLNKMDCRLGGRATSGRILQHCKRMVSALRENMGITLTVFKIGVTNNPVSRYLLYRAKNYTTMWVVHSNMDVRETHMLEAALISLFQDGTGCQNTPDSGGEGALNRSSSQGPYYTYVVGGRADQRVRVG